MRFAALVMLLLFLLASSGPAQTGYFYVPNANPGAGACNGYPWSIHSEWRFQMRIPAASLGGAPFRITELAFAPCGSSNFSSPQCEIRMGHTTLTQFNRNFDQNLGKTPSVLFNGPLTWTLTGNTWCDVGLTGVFDYNGTDNLIVEVRYTSRSGGTSCHTDGGTIERLYNFGSGAYVSANGGSQIDKWAPNLRFTVVQAVLTGSGTPRPGNTIDLDILAPADAGLPYQLATSLSTGPIVLGNRQIGLGPDDLLVVSIFGYLPSVFVNYAAILDANGKAKAKINLLNSPALVGLRLHSAFVTLHPSSPFGIRSISNTFSFSVQR